MHTNQTFVSSEAGCVFVHFGMQSRKPIRCRRCASPSPFHSGCFSLSSTPLSVWRQNVESPQKKSKCPCRICKQQPIARKATLQRHLLLGAWEEHFRLETGRGKAKADTQSFHAHNPTTPCCLPRFKSWMLSDPQHQSKRNVKILIFF